MVQCSWKAFREENTKYMEIQKNVTEIPKSRCVADYKENLSQTAFFPPQLGEEDGKTRKKVVYPAK